MECGNFYFLKENYFTDFPDRKLLRNHPADEQGPHDRPYFCAFCDSRNPDIYWMVPLSSRIDKFREIRHRKVQQWGYCDTILLRRISKRTQAVLIQNMCPISIHYIKNLCTLSNGPLRASSSTTEEIQRKAKGVLAKHLHQQMRIIEPDVRSIYSTLDWVSMLDKAAERMSAREDQTSMHLHHPKKDDLER